jgi:hypothetical protein
MFARSMEQEIPFRGTPVPPGRAPSPLQRLASFRFTYLAFCAFVLLYTFSVRAVEALLATYFQIEIAERASVEAGEEHPAQRVAREIDALLNESRWIRWGGVRVDPLVLGADERTLLFAPGMKPPEVNSTRWSALARDLFPAKTRVALSVPYNSLVANLVLVLYATLLLTLLFVYTRVLTRREQERLDRVIATRDAVAGRAAQIEAELGAVRERLAQVEPSHESDAAEIRALRGERAALMARLGELETREEALRAAGAQSTALQEEYQALEGLLDEALSDLGRKDEEMRALQKQAKQRPPSRREDEQLARRLRTLYKNLEVEERALADLLGLRDESLILRAEEMLKRLSDDADHTAIRRKVGGLPPHLSIFELGFAGGGRIYYSKGRVRRFRVLAIGDKASQKRDLEFLSRLPKES